MNACVEFVRSTNSIIAKDNSGVKTRFSRVCTSGGRKYQKLSFGGPSSNWVPSRDEDDSGAGAGDEDEEADEDEFEEEEFDEEEDRDADDEDDDEAGAIVRTLSGPACRKSGFFAKESVACSDRSREVLYRGVFVTAPVLSNHLKMSATSLPGKPNKVTQASWSSVIVSNRRLGDAE